ncbi:MAG: hypothetical protein M3512_08590 [Bacteroidota bacterium]|nr:hypothetical protein [Bacteroidota bacterium]
MLNSGDRKIYKKIVLPEDIAAFPEQVVHEVYATFSLARDMEWCSRLFVLDLIKEDEEGIGTELHVKHLHPAIIGEEVVIEATVISFVENALLCEIVVKVGERIVATGETGQKIIKKEKLKELLAGLKQ